MVGSCCERANISMPEIKMPVKVELIITKDTKDTTKGRN